MHQVIDILANSKKVNFMEKVNIHIKSKKANIRASLDMVRNTDWVFIDGKMVRLLKVIGWKVKEMVREY